MGLGHEQSPARYRMGAPLPLPCFHAQEPATLSHARQAFIMLDGGEYLERKRNTGRTSAGPISS